MSGHLLYFLNVHTKVKILSKAEYYGGLTNLTDMLTLKKKIPLLLWLQSSNFYLEKPQVSVVSIAGSHCLLLKDTVSPMYLGFSLSLTLSDRDAEMIEAVPLLRKKEQLFSKTSWVWFSYLSSRPMSLSKVLKNKHHVPSDPTAVCILGCVYAYIRIWETFSSLSVLLLMLVRGPFLFPVCLACTSYIMCCPICRPRS